MSKKNKKLKQLLNSQISAGISSGALAKATEQRNSAPTTASSILQDANANEKDVAEVVLIKKDVYFSLILIAVVIILLIAIYVIDRSNPFLLDLANKIFKLIQR